MTDDVVHIPSFKPVTIDSRQQAPRLSGYLATCSCGWQGPKQRAKPDAAKAEALWHATHQGEGEAA